MTLTDIHPSQVVIPDQLVAAVRPIIEACYEADRPDQLIGLIVDYRARCGFVPGTFVATFVISDAAQLAPTRVLAAIAGAHRQINAEPDDHGRLPSDEDIASAVGDVLHLCADVLGMLYGRLVDELTIGAAL